MSYSPAIGRWVEQDPEGSQYIDGINLYQMEGSNPVKYVDPFGTLKRDANGKLMEKVVGEFTYVHSSGEKWKTMHVKLICDDGTEIDAYRNIDKPTPNHDYDCHGMTFADKKYWIDNDQIDALLKGDHYVRVKAGEEKKGDIVIYMIRDVVPIAHSATIIAVDENGNIIVDQKAGINDGPTTKPIDDGFTDKDAVPVVYRKGPVPPPPGSTTKPSGATQPTTKPISLITPSSYGNALKYNMFSSIKISERLD